MNVWVIIGLVVAGVVALPLLMAALPPGRPHNLTREDVAAEIEAFLDSRGGAFDWDDFCTFTIADPELDKIRARCSQLDQEFPSGSAGGYCNEAGLNVLRGYVAELRRSNA
jgi:hypothetical protein